MPLQQKQKHLRQTHTELKKTQETNKSITNTCMATEKYQHKKEAEAITIEKQNSSFLNYTTCTVDDVQLG
jgi:hypothetical protein